MLNTSSICDVVYSRVHVLTIFQLISLDFHGEAIIEFDDFEFRVIVGSPSVSASSQSGKQVSSGSKSTSGI